MIRWADCSVADYADYAKTMTEAYAAQNHAQVGDPAKLGKAIVRLSREAEPPLRFLAGSDAVRYVGGGYAARMAELEEWKALSTTTDIGPPASNAG